jgi:hypothetical protein
VRRFVPLLALIGMVSEARAGDGVVWSWDRDDPACVLRQDIDGRVLKIGRTPGNDQTSLIIEGSMPITYARKTFQGGSIGFQPTGSVEAEPTVIEGADRRRAIYALSRDPNFMAKFSGASEVVFRHEKAGETKALIRAAGAAANALRACEDRKMREWGIDPVGWRALSVKPKPKTPVDKWLSWLDYPDREIAYKDDIFVVARLDLGADGSVQGCTVVNGPPKEFIDASCKALRRNAKLQPARDAAGVGVPSLYVIEVRFGAYLL